MPNGEGNIFDRLAAKNKNAAQGNIFERLAAANKARPTETQQVAAGLPQPTAPIPQDLQKKQPPIGGGYDPVSGLSLAQVQSQNIKSPPGRILPYIGGAVGGLAGGVPGAALGGVIGSALSPQTYQGDMSSYTQNPAANMLKAGVEQGAYELGGKAISAVGAKLMPNAIKRGMANLLRSQLDQTGQAVDRYLTQPHINAQTADYATPLNRYLDSRIALASRTGDTGMARGLTKLKNTWATNYNLTQATPMEATKFARDIGKLTSFGNVADKLTVNQVKKEVVGLMSGEVRNNVAGVEALRDKYAAYASAQGAINKTTAKAMKSYPGAAAGITGSALQSVGPKFPNIARTAIGTAEEK